MKALKLHFRTGADLLGSLESHPAPGAMFCPTTTPYRQGDELLLQWTSPELPNPVVLRGTVRSWRPALPRRRIRAGAMVELWKDDAEKVEFVRRMLSGKGSAVRRRHTRIPVEVPVRYRTPEVADFTDSGLTEISVGGALLRTSSGRPLEIGDEVILELLPPGAVSPLSIASRVAYRAPASAAESVGLKFLCRDSGGSRRLREIVRRLTEG